MRTAYANCANCLCELLMRTAYANCTGKRTDPAEHAHPSSLFVGIDFSSRDASRAAATREASWLCSQLKDCHNILTSLDGPVAAAA